MLKRATILLILILVVLVAGASYAILKGEKIDTIWKNGTSENLKEPFSVLVMGQVGKGQGGQWHFAPDLADTIVLIQFNPETEMINLISLPRDLYGDFGDYRFKINRVISDSRIDEVMLTLPAISGIETKNYVILDLSVVKEIVDGLGGIQIELAEPIYDPVGSFYLKAGTNHLNGEDVVWLIRNRYAPQGDFFREKNQHLVLEAIFNKFNELTSLKKTSFIFRMLPQISKSTSNFSLGQTISNFRDVKNIGFNSIVLDFDTKLWQSMRIPNPSGEDAYVLVPKDGINQYKPVKEYIQEHLR
ncbi:MAG: hypothetical protein COT89_00140 [Candidatus Colwellbacteria bacterium CG10_big_fil_rev_8_21_14_0_10_42_22]|uniref:Cell envelope-related transcriptional attenuator domain-containing protein n=1 Tax=Candidatus Colwellbacteria bacterium CG10_big_fil_rev_8_21_14_0_10_42_22 TaxID=1974540 RepID=A0A2H0VGS7_9BACT|nr:MAG: hypothetical protein COT89_00140 [Candidatus Colwellbacteria bacterium CG10_big_fil_rev_8_21_14_0_10_42_22]